MMSSKFNNNERKMNITNIVRNVPKTEKNIINLGYVATLSVRVGAHMINPSYL